MSIYKINLHIFNKFATIIDVFKKKGANIVANIKSAKKAIKVTAKVTANNHELKAKSANLIKNCDKAINAKDKKQASELYIKVQKTLDKAQAKGLMKKNTVAREKSRLNAKIKAMN